MELRWALFQCYSIHVALVDGRDIFCSRFSRIAIWRCCGVKYQAIIFQRIWLAANKRLINNELVDIYTWNESNAYIASPTQQQNKTRGKRKFIGSSSCMQSHNRCVEWKKTERKNTHLLTSNYANYCTCLWAINFRVRNVWHRCLECCLLDGF